MADNKLSFTQLINGEKPVMVDFWPNGAAPAK